MNALIVCHAGAGMGLGHLTRSLLVARALQQELGAHVRLLVQGDEVGRDDLGKFPHHFLNIDDNLGDAVCQLAKQYAIQLVVFDLQPQRIPSDMADLLKRLRSAGCRLVGVDSLLAYGDLLDLIFIPSFQFSMPRGLSVAMRVVYGWDCFLLNVKYPPTEWRAGNNVLVLTGGSDATGLGKTWPGVLNETLPAGVVLNWVTGPYAAQPVWPASLRINMVNNRSPEGLDDLMVTASYATTVYGVSFYELLYYGIPTVVFSPYADKDNAELAGIAEAGVALVAKDHIEATLLLNKLMDDEELAKSLSMKARRKMSVVGGRKFAGEVAALMGK